MVMKKSILFFFLAIAIFSLFFFNHKIELRGNENVAVEIWKDIYGEDYVIQIPDSGMYCFLDPEQNNPESPPTFRLHLLHSVNDGWKYENIAPTENDVFRCYSDKMVYHVGEIITVRFENNSEHTLSTGFGDAFYLDILVNGVWYPINRDWSIPGTEVRMSKGSFREWVIDEKTFALSRNYYDDETGTYLSDSENVYTVELPKGHYRFVIRFNDVTPKEDTTPLKYFGAQCEFDIE